MTPAPALQPGDTLVPDSLRIRKNPGVREAVEAAGARLLLFPSHSPNLGPMEQAARPRALPSGAAARTVTDPHPAIRQALGRSTPQECRNHVTAAGYEDAAVAT